MIAADKGIILNPKHRMKFRDQAIGQSNCDLYDVESFKEYNQMEEFILNADPSDKGMGKLLANKPNLDEEDV
jgi:hypothetical protein